MQTDRPPQWIINWLRKFIKPYYFDGIYGDLLEDFHNKVQKGRKSSAHVWFLLNAIGMLTKPNLYRSFAIHSDRSNYSGMIKNFTVTSLRLFNKRKVHYLLSIIGLSIGLAAFVGIWKFASLEESYDQIHREGIFRIIRIDNATSKGLANSKPDLIPAIENSISSVQTGTRFFRRKNASIKVNRKDVNETFTGIDFLYADKNFLTVFSFSDDPALAAALEEPNIIIVTHSLAQRLFNDTDPIGKVVSLKDPNFPLTDFIVKGVIDDVSPYSHFNFNALVSMNTPMRNGKSMAELGWNGFYSYAVIDANASKETFLQNIRQFSERYYPEKNMTLDIQPLRDIHLHSQLDNELEKNGNHQLVLFLKLSAFFILIMAYFNYINLTTAKSVERAREMGVRKVLGSLNFYIQIQVFVETLLVNIIALILSLGMLWVTVQYLPLGWNVSKLFSFSVQEVMFVIGVMVAGSFMSGFYPAMVLASFRPSDIFRHSLRFTSRGFGIRSLLTSLQFGTSIALIIIGVVIIQQIKYMVAYDKGVDIDHTVIISPPDIRDENYREELKQFEEKLNTQTFVASVSTASIRPGFGYNYSAQGRRIAANAKETVTFYVDGIDDHFVSHYNIKIVAGRSFDLHFHNEKGNVVINEAACALLGFEKMEAAIGENIIIENDTLRIIGIIANYNQKGLQRAYDPQVLMFYGGFIPHFSVKLQAASESIGYADMIHDLELDYRSVFPGSNMSYYFLDDAFNQQYEDEMKFEQASQLFMIISVLISCIGLVSFISYTLTSRMKEIILRKIFGASTLHLLAELSRQVLLLVTIGGIMGMAFSYYLAEQWLSEFAFRISLSPLFFILPVALVLFFTMLILTTLAFRSVNQSPSTWKEYMQ